MLRRRIFVFLMPMFLVACQPKEVAITESQKAELTINKDTKADVMLVCPLFSILKDGQCLCYDEPLALVDAQSWTCVYDAWVCSTVGGCKHGNGVCGFGGKLEADICTCMDVPPNETLLGDYRCQNNYWVCDNVQGCGKDRDASAYGEIGFKPVADCFGVELREDLAKYRCEDKLWTCRHSKGCSCGGEVVPLGSHCIEGKAFCGTFPKPERGNYTCVGACVPQLTSSVYQWVCQDRDACPCGDNGCGFGGSCQNGECVCGDNPMPDAIKQYRCYSELMLGVINDKASDLGYWICNREAGCFCGDTQCAMGETCLPDGKCEDREVDRPKHYEDYHYENGAWTCLKPEGCRCGETFCGDGESCYQEQCSCYQDQDCSQSVCSDGKCVDNITCGVAAAPQRPGYLCENETWICRDDLGCFCGNALYGHGIECRENKAVCGTPDNIAPQNPQTYICDAGQWICNNRGGCICGLSFAPSGSSCTDGVVYCGDRPIEHGEGYRCEDVDDQIELVCGYQFQSGPLVSGRSSVCSCGENACSAGSVCKDGQCLCGGKVIPPGSETEGYICQYGAYICSSHACKCGANGCGFRGRCENDRCVCGPNAKVAPQNASSYGCYHYDDKVTFVCNDKSGCRCGGVLCGYNSNCVDDKFCVCDDVLAPKTDPEKYICHDGFGIWICNDPEGCPFLGGICPKGHFLEDDKCIKPSFYTEEDADDEAEQDEFCVENKRPPMGDYDCELHSNFSLGFVERSGWTCKIPEGCPCGAETNADICRSTCIRSDKDGHCLEYTWHGQKLPICYGPKGIGGNETCDADSSDVCNGFQKPSTPGYRCDERGWICDDKLCVCRLGLCLKDHYCIDDDFYIP